LRNFTALFRKVDTDTNGIVNEAEFIKFIASLNVYSNTTFNDNVKRVLKIMDPYNNKQFTYSDCVCFFQKESIELIEGGKKVEMTVLDKVTIE
jgi:hypothetical protein